MKISNFKPSQNIKERHIALCYDPVDETRVLPIIKELYKRGIRTWYCAGFSDDYKKEEERMSSIETADVLLVIRSKDSLLSRFIKSTSLFFEDAGKRIVFIDFDVESSDALSMGLKNDHLVLDGRSSLESIIDSIIHTDGFVQDIFTEPFVPNSRVIKYVAIGIAIIAVIISSLSLLFGKGYISFAASKDSVEFFDKTIERGARYSIAGNYKVSLTEENISSIEILYLDKIPKNCIDLSKFTSLKTVVMPQCSKEVAEYILSYDIELLIYGGSGND